jgi:hypothetical protein
LEIEILFKNNIVRRQLKCRDKKEIVKQLNGALIFANGRGDNRRKRAVPGRSLVTRDLENFKVQLNF